MTLPELQLSRIQQTLLLLCFLFGLADGLLFGLLLITAGTK